MGGKGKERWEERARKGGWKGHGKVRGKVKKRKTGVEYQIMNLL